MLIVYELLFTKLISGKILAFEVAALIYFYYEWYLYYQYVENNSDLYE